MKTLSRYIVVYLGMGMALSMGHMESVRARSFMNHAMAMVTVVFLFQSQGVLVGGTGAPTF